MSWMMFCFESTKSMSDSRCGLNKELGCRRLVLVCNLSDICAVGVLPKVQPIRIAADQPANTSIMSPTSFNIPRFTVHTSLDHPPCPTVYTVVAITSLIYTQRHTSKRNCSSQWRQRPSYLTRRHPPPSSPPSESSPPPDHVLIQFALSQVRHGRNNPPSAPSTLLQHTNHTAYPTSHSHLATVISPTLQ